MTKQIERRRGVSMWLAAAGLSLWAGVAALTWADEGAPPEAAPAAEAAAEEAKNAAAEAAPAVEEAKDAAPAAEPAPAPAAEDDLLSGDSGEDDLLSGDAATPPAAEEDDLLSAEPTDDLLTAEDSETSTGLKAPAKFNTTEPDRETAGVVAGPDPHAEVYAKSAYPAASECAKCHQQIYDEWASSNHAYASISPMFHKFEQRINDLAQGTIGYFCMRCHGSVGTTLGEERWKPLWERVPVSREGVTCITCHRVSEEFGKVNGERRIEPGPIYNAMYGPIGGGGVAAVVGDPDQWKVKTSPDDPNPGMPIHTQGIKFEQINKSEFCVSCHQVAVYPNIKLEVVWEQYRASPAFEQGISCQECHMGKVPGKAEGWATGPAAVINGKPVNIQRQHSNHAFYGPGYPIAHPGIFPHNPRNNEFSVDTWLKYDYRGGWGKAEWEDKVESGEIKAEFPEEWSDRFDRETAREIVEENLKKLEYKRELRKMVMENGSHADGPFFVKPPKAGKPLKFYYVYHNTNPGHNLPSGSLGAQPEIWLNVALIDPDGQNIWESGYVDSEGDMCDIHSADVGKGKYPFDEQLVNLQSKFLTTNIKGTDREMFLPVNVDIDQLPFIRPFGAPTTVLNHPPFIRMEGRSIPPLGKKKANYEVPAKLMKKPGTYKLSFRVRSRAEPIYFMKFVGATEEMKQSMNEWMMDIHPYTVSFEVK